MFGKSKRCFGDPLTGWRPRALFSLLMLSVLAGNARAYAGQWEFQGFTIAESTPVFERTAISTAGRSNRNNVDLNVTGGPALREYQCAATSSGRAGAVARKGIWTRRCRVLLTRFRMVGRSTVRRFGIA